jgi:hypothetical protein
MVPTTKIGSSHPIALIARVQMIVALGTHAGNGSAHNHHQSIRVFLTCLVGEFQWIDVLMASNPMEGMRG